MNGFAILAIYAVVMITATLIFTKKEKNVERFCVGSRKENWIMSALSIAATWIWAPALFVSTEKAYANGFVGLFWFLVPNVLCLILFIPFAKRIRREMPEGITLSGYMRDKYKSDGVKRVYLFQLMGLSVLSTGVQLLAGNGLYETLLRMNREEALVYKYEDLTEAQKKKLMIADNKIFSLGIENLDTLNEFLEELSGDLDIPGFDEEILKQMVADADEITEKISEYGTLDEEEVRKIKEANEKREQREAFENKSHPEEPVEHIAESEECNAESNQAPAEAGRFVICPKCGEKIWL